MKHTLTSASESAPLLAFGAHPDDIEFGCGGVVTLESRAGRMARMVVCSRGESGSRGMPKQRTAEAREAAKLLGAKLEWLKLDGDAHLEIKVAHTIKLASIIRRVKPGIILAPSLVENQHPDHSRLGQMVRDAARLARYGGVKELRKQKPHAIGQLLYYALTPESEPRDISPVLIDISGDEVITAWVNAMNAHASQMSIRHYSDLQVMRARLNGQRAGVDYATPLFPNDAPLFSSLSPLSCGARRF
jgi:LmbE family N-acetylglucosaminyl deacetylase